MLTSNSPKSYISHHNKTSKDYTQTENIESKESLISVLRKQIFDMEQEEKNYNSLNMKYKATLNELNVVSEQKLKIEYDYKQRCETMIKQINNLKEEVEMLSTSIEEKSKLNKKLYHDNTELTLMVDEKSNEISYKNQLLDDLNYRLDEYSTNNVNLKEQNDLNLKEIERLKFELNKSFNEKQDLSMALDEVKVSKERITKEKRMLDDNIATLLNDMSNLKETLKDYEQKFIDSRRNIDQTTKLNNSLENKLIDLEEMYNNVREDAVTAKKEANSEKKFRQELQKIIETNTEQLADKDRHIRNQAFDLEAIKNEKESILDESYKQKQQIENLKNSISILKEENKRLIAELNIILEEDSFFKKELSFIKDQNNRVLSANKFNVEKSLNNLGDFMSKMYSSNDFNKENDEY